MKLISNFFQNLPVILPNSIISVEGILNENFNLKNYKLSNNDFLIKNRNKIDFSISRIDILFFQVYLFLIIINFLVEKV